MDAHTHTHPDNPVVFFEVTIGGIEAGRIKMELFKDIVPRTAENFRRVLHAFACARQRSHTLRAVCTPRQLCTGEFRCALLR